MGFIALLDRYLYRYPFIIDKLSVGLFNSMSETIYESHVRGLTYGAGVGLS